MLQKDVYIINIPIHLILSNNKSFNDTGMTITTKMLCFISILSYTVYM